MTDSFLPSWDLNDLYATPSDSQINLDLQKAIQQSTQFRDKYQGQIENLTAPQMKECLIEYENISELSVKPLIYAMLVHAADSSKAEHGALVSSLQEKYTEVSQNLTFFTLEWNQIEDQKASDLLSQPELQQYVHYLKDVSKYKKHQLTEKEEILWQKLSLTGENAWTRLFDEIFSSMKFNMRYPSGNTESLSEEEVLALLYTADRETRSAASDALTEGLIKNKHILTYIFNVILQDSLISDQTRQYTSPKHSRNLSNEISDESVNNLLQSAESQTHTIQKFYALKQKLLGLNELKDYDRYAPIPLSTSQEWSWNDACQFVQEAYTEFSSQAGDIVQEFYDKKWIDADLRPGKRGGAFSASTVPSAHPYILVNFTGTSRDVSTLAHELGHGIHQYLSRQVGYLNADTPLTTAETASVFGELLVFEKMLNAATSDEEKLSLLVVKLDDIFATVFRQACMTRFEEKIHNTRRLQGELTTEQFNELWIQANQDMFGDSIQWTDNYASWWSYIPHFIHSPFYCYAYSFGLLLSITLYNQYKISDNKADFIEKYLQVLSLGGSVAPDKLMSIMNIDLNDINFWNNGFKLIEEFVDQACKLGESITACK